MICNYNVLTKLHTPLQVADSILLLMFSSTSLFREAIAAIEEGRHNAAFDRICKIKRLFIIIINPLVKSTKWVPRRLPIYGRG